MFPEDEFAAADAPARAQRLARELARLVNGSKRLGGGTELLSAAELLRADAADVTLAAAALFSAYPQARRPRPPPRCLILTPAPSHRVSI